ncbi:MAG: type II secretion system protein [Verrucomicrobiota bacterium]
MTESEYIRSRFRRGFTLVELLVVLSILAVLAGMIIGTAGPIQRKARTHQTTVEIAGIELAVANFKTDQGDFPQINFIGMGNGIYEGNPDNYMETAQALFQDLCRGGEPDASYDIAAEAGVTIYLTDVKRTQVGDPEGSSFLRDPFQKPYGYFYDYKTQEKSLFNIVEPDIWSTTGEMEEPLDNQDAVYLRWVKNWTEID